MYLKRFMRLQQKKKDKDGSLSRRETKAKINLEHTVCGLKEYSTSAAVILTFI